MGASAATLSETTSGRSNRSIQLTALVIGLAAITMNLGLLLFQRQGLGFPPGLIGLALSVVTVYCLGSTALGALLSDALWRAVARLAFLPAAGLTIVALQDSPSALFVLLFVLCVWFTWVLWRRRADLSGMGGSVLTTALIVLGLGLVLLSGFQYSEQQSHFLMPEYMDLGILHSDPLGLIAVGSTISNGTGPAGVLDGFRVYHYHFGMMYLVAAAAKLAGTSHVMAQMAVHQLILLPLIFFHVTQATTSGRSEPRQLDFRAPIAVALMFLVPFAAWPIVFYSESSAAALPFLFLFLTYARAWYVAGVSRRSRLASLLAILPILAFSLHVKLPVGFMLFAFAGYMALELLTGFRARRSIVVYLVGASAIALFALAQVWPWYSFIPPPADLMPKVRWTLSELRADAVGLLVIPVILAVRYLQRRSAPTCWDSILPGTIGRPYLLWFVGAAAGGAMVAVFNHPYNVRYLFNSIDTSVIPLAASVLAFELARLPRGRPQLSWLVGGVLILGLVAMAEVTRLKPTEAASRITAGRDAICDAVYVEGVCPDARGPFSSPRPDDFPGVIRNSTGGRLIAQARALVERGAEAFFVPHDADPVWRFLLSGVSRPSDNLQFLPAHTGLPMVLGLPPSRYNVELAVINAKMPGTYDDTARSHAVTDQELCAHAIARHLHVVAVIADPAPSESNRILDCRELRGSP